jgi:protein TonB
MTTDRSGGNESRVRSNDTKGSDAQAAAAQQKALAAAQAERDAATAAAAATQKAAADAAAAAAQAAAAAAAQAPVQLKRTKTVAPVFPDSAKNRSGWVEVSFTVGQSGAVENVRVSNSEPKDVFDAAAIQAVEQWRYEPPMRDGKPTTQAIKIKLRFDAR